MRAIRIDQLGGQVRLEEIAAPVPGPGEALIEVRAAALTAGELTWPRHWPATLSHEVAGIVTELGPEPSPSAPQVGQAVSGLVNFDLDGGAAEYVTMPAADLAVKPGSLDYPDAACLTLAPLTAWQALYDHGHVTAGQHVLVNGAAGGVGSYAVQLAAALGATVTAIASAADAGYVTELGATKVIDYANLDLPQGDIDVAIDLVGGEAMAALWPTLRSGGILIGIADEPSAAEAEQHDVRSTFFIVEPSGSQLAELAKFAEAGLLRTTISQVLPLNDAADALAALDQRGHRGKIVLSVRNPAIPE
jgi:NADPH:quinone reductase-like Zn-dependent oxidoreductase